jgi:hypothetical protein
MSRRAAIVGEVALALATMLSLAALGALARGQGESQSPELLEGVKDVAAPGMPSPLAVWGKDAWVVLSGNGGEGVRATAIAAGKAGAGRFVALPHGGYFAAAALDKGDTRRFLVNAVRWTAGPGKSKPRVAARGADVVALLNESGCDAHALGATPLSSELASVDVVCGVTSDLAPEDFEPLLHFLTEGGGVIAAQSLWTWQQTGGARSLDENPLNRLFGRFGVAWAPGHLGKVGEIGYSTERAPPKLLHGELAVGFLHNHLDPKSLDNERPMQQSIATFAVLAPVLPLDDAFVRPRVDPWIAKHGEELTPSPEHPLVALDGMRRSMLLLSLCDAERKPPEKVGALPCSRQFPGSVAPTAARVTRTVAIDASVPRWRSTGLYAAPGDVVTVSVPADVVGDALELQIGAHSDELFEAPEWKRAPRLVRRIALDREQVQVASALGGPIYVVVPEDGGGGKVELKFEHVVDAARFVLDADSHEQWLTAVRHRSAPWAELETSKVIVTVPSSAIADLTDPESLLRTWDRIADATADLLALPRARRCPERFVADVQLAPVRAGYPIVTRLEDAATMASPVKLAAGDWDLFHLLAQDHADEDWIFEGAGDVTNDLVALYVLETVCNRPVATDPAPPSVVTDGAARVAAYLRDGAKFDDWKKDPALALQPWLQLQRAFGWDLYRKVFREYRGLPQRDKPKSDDERRDLWLATLSRGSGRDLSRFFTTWGIPTSETARALVSSLPEWMPEGFPGKQ